MLGFSVKILHKLYRFFVPLYPPTKECKCDYANVPQIDISIDSPDTATDNLTDPILSKNANKNVHASITFSILDDGNVYINCQWDKHDNKDSMAMIYGELLYKINSGDFIEDIINILIQQSEEHEEHTEIIMEILNYWKMIKEHTENQPLIKPSDVFAQQDMSNSPDYNIGPEQD